MINIGKYCSSEEKQRSVTLFQQYFDVLAYSYDDLKYFRPEELRHEIPLKPGFAPFRQKQW